MLYVTFLSQPNLPNSPVTWCVEIYGTFIPIHPVYGDTGIASYHDKSAGFKFTTKVMSVQVMRHFEWRQNHRPTHLALVWGKHPAWVQIYMVLTISKGTQACPEIMLICDLWPPATRPVNILPSYNLPAKCKKSRHLFSVMRSGDHESQVLIPKIGW